MWIYFFNLFSNLSTLVTYYNILKENNSLEIEKYIKSNSNSRTSNTKRKLFDETIKSGSSKKAKYDDTENKPKTTCVRETRSTAKLRKPLKALDINTNNSEPVLENQQSSNSIKINNNISFANIQIKQYEPRMSLDCCLNLLALTQVSNQSYFKDLKITQIDLNAKERLLSLITNTHFYEYLVKIIEKKLEFISKVDLNNNIENILDMKFKEPAEIFNTLKLIWK